MIQFGFLYNFSRWLEQQELNPILRKDAIHRSYAYEHFLMKQRFYFVFSDSPFQLHLFSKEVSHPLLSYTVKECKFIVLTEGITGDLSYRAAERGKLLLNKSLHVWTYMTYSRMPIQDRMNSCLLLLSRAFLSKFLNFALQHNLRNTEHM